MIVFIIFTLGIPFVFIFIWYLIWKISKSIVGTVGAIVVMAGIVIVPNLFNIMYWFNDLLNSSDLACAVGCIGLFVVCIAIIVFGFKHSDGEVK